MTGLLWKAYLIASCTVLPMREEPFQHRHKCEEFVFFANNQNQLSAASAQCWPIIER